MPVPDFSPGEVLTAAAMDSIGLWLVTTATVSAQTTLTVDNCFTSDYANYRIVISMVGVTDQNNLGLQLLDSSGTVIATNYQATAYGLDYATPGTTFATVGSATQFNLGFLANSSSHGAGSYNYDISGPQLSTQRTSINGLFTGVSSGSAFRGGFAFGLRSAAETARGFRLINGFGTNITGTARVYGYRN
jgi:hypothetical protein